MMANNGVYKVAEDELLSYQIRYNGTVYYVRSVYKCTWTEDGRFLRGHNYRIGNTNGYKTERGAINAIKRVAKANGYTLV